MFSQVAPLVYASCDKTRLIYFSRNEIRIGRGRIAWK
jgi:hypothetical protein